MGDHRMRSLARTVCSLDDVQQASRALGTVMRNHRARAGTGPGVGPPERARGRPESGPTGVAAVRTPGVAGVDERKQFRVIVVSEHDVLRAGMASLIGSEPGYTVVGEANDGRQAIEVVTKLVPDVVLMDVRLPDIDGIEAARRIWRSGTGSAVVLFSTECDAATLMDALRAGVKGYVLKDVGRQGLLTVLRSVITGGHAIEATLATNLLRQMAAESESNHASAPERLTPREVEVLRLITQGRTNREIASRLIVAVGTVKVHVEHIMAKLGAADRTQAAVRAVEMGIITHIDDPDGEAPAV